jgi:two-component sensor histidine kinase
MSENTLAEMAFPRPDFLSLFNALSQPSFVVSLEGRVAFANRASIILLGHNITGLEVGGVTADKPDELRTFLRRSAGSKQATVGKLNLRTFDGRVHSVRCQGRLLCPADGESEALILLDCTTGADRFSILADQVRQLTEETRKRRHVQAVLEESLRERDVLMRELHHRVRNNLHMVSSMLQIAKSETGSPEARAALQDAASRIAAVGAVQQILYVSDQGGDVSITELVRKLCQSLAANQLSACEMVMDLESVSLSAEFATPLALILNELLTNAAKHAGNGTRRPRINVELRASPSEIVLTVKDNGPGFDIGDSRKRASGLGLIRGMLRQVGGRIEVQNNEGAQCSIHLAREAETGRAQ